MNKKQNFQWDEMSLGTCYYPEHWDRELWKSDLERMRSSGIETVRIAEFAWSKFEPTEGNFTFEFFDDFMDVAQEMEFYIGMVQEGIIIITQRNIKNYQVV